MWPRNMPGPAGRFSEQVLTGLRLRSLVPTHTKDFTPELLLLKNTTRTHLFGIPLALCITAPPSPSSLRNGYTRKKNKTISSRYGKWKPGSTLRFQRNYRYLRLRPAPAEAASPPVCATVCVCGGTLSSSHYTEYLETETPRRQLDWTVKWNEI